MTIETIVMSRITVAGANRSTVVPTARNREDAPIPASATKTKGIRAKANGAVNTAAVLLRAEVATTKAVAKIMTVVGKVIAITPAIVIATTEPPDKIITRVPLTTDRTGAAAPTGTDKARVITGRTGAVTTVKAPAVTERVPA
jgi:hypothetical protein